MNKITIQKLNKLGACMDAVKWAKEHPNRQAAWDTCERGDWMLWLLGRLSGKPESEKRKKLVLAACECASLALKHSGKNRAVCEKALRTAKAWTRGKATIKDVRAAADDAAADDAAYAAADAAYDAAADDAGDAAYAAAYVAAAAYAAYAATAAAYDAAADDAAYAATAAYGAAVDAARTKTLNKCANIVRKHYSNAPKF
jgi:hypothetical protein